MENNKEETQQEFDLDDIMKEFSHASGDAPASEESPAAEMAAPLNEEDPPEVTGDTIRLDTLNIPTVEKESVTDETIRLSAVAEAVSQEEPAAESAEPEEPVEPFSEEWEPEYDQPMGEYVPPFPKAEPIVFRPKNKLRELKKKLIAGPEKRYYDLSEMGVGKLQIAILLNVLIVLLCAGAAFAFASGGIPANRMRLLIFSQMLAMLVSALLGCYALMDGAADLMKLRFSMNSMMLLTFVACCVDVVFCLKELRVPCCAAFSLEVTMALWSRYHNRTTEMGQMDTLRKATKLNSVVRVSDFYEGRAGLLRGEGEVEHFMDNYQETPKPEKTQCFFAFIAFLVCIGIAVVAGLRHGVSMAVRIFSTSLLVATPASFFVALSRPMAVLERRLHMTGTVICGWQGVQGLCGNVTFPVKDSDLFPLGAVKLNGVKFYGDRKPDEVIAYAASLMEENGGGLQPLFHQLLQSRNGRTYEVGNFRDYERGGIGGEVCDEPVLLGTLSFLQDMGVEIPEGTMVSQAVYAAIDGQLCAVFAFNYSRAKSAAAGMVSLCGYRKLTPVMLCDDFMLGESFLRSKFSVNTRRVAFPNRETRGELSRKQIEEGSVSLALTTQDGLSSSVYAVTGARALRRTYRMGLSIHIFAGIVGMLSMLALAYLGSAYLLTPMNVLLYQLVWTVPGLLTTNWTKIV